MAVRSIRSAKLGAPSLKALDPAAARWIGSLIRVSSQHPAMTRVLDVIERLSDRPFRTNCLLTGEPGTGKDGLARALHQLMAPGKPLVRFDVRGFPEEAALEALCGAGRGEGAADRANGGMLLIEEVVGLPGRVQEALLRLIKAGRVRRVGQDKDLPGKLSVNAVALSDENVERAVADGRLRHDLYYRLARIPLWLPPLRERTDDVGPAVIWMGNRILATARIPLELRSADDLARASAEERKRSIEIDPAALEALRAHGWPGNFRELEAVLERALLLYRTNARLEPDHVRSALQAAKPA